MSSHADDSDSPEIDMSEWGDNPWNHREPLAQLLSAGYNGREITEIFQEHYEDCPSYSTIQRRINDYGLTPNHHQPKYREDWSPVYAESLSFPIPEPVTEALTIEQGTILRYQAVVTEDDTLGFTVTAWPEREHTFANERHVRTGDTILPIGRMPAQLATYSGLSEAAAIGAPDDALRDRSPAVEGTPAIAQFQLCDGSTGFRLTTIPPLRLWTPTPDAPTFDVEEVAPVDMTLDPKFSNSGGDTTDDVRSYRLRFPTTYRDAYGLLERDELTVAYTRTNGTNTPAEPAVALIPRTPSDRDTPGDPDVTVPIGTFEAGEYRDGERTAPHDVAAISPPKAVLNSLGIGLKTPHPPVRLIPRTTHIEMRPR